jgi:tetratricopeptide (TPR) repeat protein
MLKCRQAVSRIAVAGLFLFTFSIFIAGCSSVTINDALRNSSQIADQAMVDGVPFYPQEELQCGPATLAMALSWSGLTVRPEELAAEVYTPERKGSLQSALVASARRHGRIAYPISGADLLFAEVAAGRPVIVLLNLAFSWYPKWHYAVVIGYDKKADVIILHSGKQANESLSFRVFSNIWARSEYWGLLILSPSEMPVAPDAEKWLEAIVGLELAEQWHAATVVYEKASERWPHNHNAWIGLGNSRYALQDFAGAASAFREAMRIRPESGIAYNNLAQVLAQTGQYEEAAKAAKRAVALGGPLQETYLKTLTEITSNNQHAPQHEDLK